MKSSLLLSLSFLLLLTSCSTPSSLQKEEKASPVKTERQVRLEKEKILQTEYNQVRTNTGFLELENEYNIMMASWDTAGMEAVRTKMKAYYSDDLKETIKDLNLQ
jgi:hypothetical protein